MNANKQAKAAEVKEITSKITSAKGIVIAEYAGLTVKQLQTLRKELKAAGVEAKVYKNRLFKIAAKEAGLGDLESSLTGPNLYIFGMDDDISPAKVVAKFAKDNEVIKMKAGTYEGKIVDSAALAEIATLPSMEEALTKLAMSLLSPIQQIGVGLKMLVDEGKLESVAEKATETPTEETKEETPTEVKTEEAPAEVKTEEVKEEPAAEKATEETKEEPAAEKATEEKA